MNNFTVVIKETLLLLSTGQKLPACLIYGKKPTFYEEIYSCYTINVYAVCDDG